MPRVALSSGAYSARSFIANAQRSLNLYPEANPDSTSPPVQVTHYPTPGLTLLGASLNSQVTWRALYLATNNVLYGVCGHDLYRINAAWGLKKLGQIGAGTTPVAMGDNGFTLVVADGTPNGWQVDLATETFGVMNDPSWVGSNTIGYVDTFLVFNQPGTRNFYSSLSNTVSQDPLYIAAKTGFPDLLTGVYVVHREIWLIGQKTTEVWYDAGTPDFPFGIIPGVFIQHGCLATYSVAKWDLQLFWLSQDQTGKAIVVTGMGYKAEKISTNAMEDEFLTYPELTDAIGFCYQQEGHIFYVLNFPTSDKTWVFDVSTKQWHERAWIDNSGAEHRIRPNCMAFAYGKNVVGDWQNGNLYAYDLNAFDDNGQPITRLRGFPHLVNDGMRVIYPNFSCDIECGSLDVVGASPNIHLEISDDRGKSYWSAPSQSIGLTGEYIAQPQWQRLGLARDRVFRVSWSVPTRTALQGAWIDVIEART